MLERVTQHGFTAENRKTRARGLPVGTEKKRTGPLLHDQQEEGFCNGLPQESGPERKFW